VRILLADDHHIVRQGIRALLERGGFEVVAEAEDGADAVRLASTCRADVAVLDLAMPRLSGIDCAREMLSRDARAAIILLTMHAEEDKAVEALRAGIRGYVVKTQATSELIQAIRAVDAGGVYCTPSISVVLATAGLAAGASAPDPLTARQRDVLRLIADGRTTREVAETLGLSVKTAELYRARIMSSLDIHDVAGLVRYAIRRGLIDL
jgi:two-component system, NarL family, response regulator NreC